MKKFKKKLKKLINQRNKELIKVKEDLIDIK